MNAAGVGVVAVQEIMVVGGAPLVMGLTRKTRARLEGRVGAGVAQPWRDLRKLFTKERIVPERSSWVFTTAPIVLIATAVFVVAVVPFAATTSAVAGAGDLFAVIYLLLLGTVFLALAGLDTGTAFGGMGASREMTVAAVTEPTVLLAIFALSVPAGTSNLSAIVASTLAHQQRAMSAASLLALAAFCVVLLAETGRLPVDNPSTHLELTMIHEAMTLEYAGPDLGVVELASAIRLTIFLGLVASLFVPWGIATTNSAAAIALGSGLFVAKVGAGAVILGAFEVFIAKLRLFRVPELLAGSFVLAFLAVTASFFLS